MSQSWEFSHYLKEYTLIPAYWYLKICISLIITKCPTFKVLKLCLQGHWQSFLYLITEALLCFLLSSYISKNGVIRDLKGNLIMDLFCMKSYKVFHINIFINKPQAFISLNFKSIRNTQLNVVRITKLNVLFCALEIQRNKLWSRWIKDKIVY